MQAHDLTRETDLSSLRDFRIATASEDCVPPSSEGPTGASQVASLQAQLRELQGELEALKADRNRIADRQRRMMELIGTTQPEHLVHDLRNVLNERELLRALTEGQF
jgi:hypothetical protein